MHVGVAGLLGVLGRGRRADDGGVHDGAASDLQPFTEAARASDAAVDTSNRSCPYR